MSKKSDTAAAPYKKLVFMGTAYTDLTKFPAAAIRATGQALNKVQHGGNPDDFKAMPIIGSGAHEIRLHMGGQWRTIYVAKFENAVYVLHCFQKKTQKTAKRDIVLAQRRYTEMLDEVTK